MQKNKIIREFQRRRALGFRTAIPGAGLALLSIGLNWISDRSPVPSVERIASVCAVFALSGALLILSKAALVLRCPACGRLPLRAAAGIGWRGGAFPLNPEECPSCHVRLSPERRHAPAGVSTDPPA